MENRWNVDEPVGDVDMKELLLVIWRKAWLVVIAAVLCAGLAFGGTYALWMMLGNSAGDFWMLFAPHVFFEFIAMALAGHLGFRLLRFLVNKTGQTFRDLLRENKAVLAVTFGSVLAAALVECFVTPYLHIFA